MHALAGAAAALRQRIPADRRRLDRRGRLARLGVGVLSRFGWLDLDPTNNLMPSSKHITLGWGRDYSDVPPVRGVALGGGEQKIAVEVLVTPTSSLSLSD